jgi:antitoxin component YwqK of YwqJK toxin-antitoxin module
MTALVLFSCTEEEETKKPLEEAVEELVEIRDGVYTEWYPGKKQVKYKGQQDEQSRRQGKWVFYAENGTELSITMYEHGVKDGFSIVKYPNGAIHYRGEYRNDQMVGIWTTFNEKGEKETEKDYGYPAE